MYPMINTSSEAVEVAYERTDLIEINSLVNILSNLNASKNEKNDLVVNVFMRNNGDKTIQVQLEGLFIDLKLRPLLKLSKIAILLPDTQPPPNSHTI